MSQAQRALGCKGWLVSQPRALSALHAKRPLQPQGPQSAILTPGAVPKSRQAGTRPAQKEGSYYNQAESSFEQAAQMEEGSWVKAMQGPSRSDFKTTVLRQSRISALRIWELWCTLWICPGCLSPGSIITQHVEGHKTSPNTGEPSNPRVRAQTGITTRTVTQQHIVLCDDPPGLV